MSARLATCGISKSRARRASTGMVGGPPAEQFKTAEEFKRTGENMSEFSGGANVCKAIRTAL